jgi:gliding motility-associated-like protein
VRKSNTGDGINDAFFPKVTGELKDYEFLVFNKWGEMLFRTRERDIGWTGWYRHEPCQQDVYVYKVKALKIDNSEVVLVGDITLLR